MRHETERRSSLTTAPLPPRRGAAAPRARSSASPASRSCAVGFAAEPRAVLQVVPAGVHVLDRRLARLAGADDGAPPVGRRLGRRHPPRARGVEPHAAVHGAALPADRLRRCTSCTSGRMPDAVAHDIILQHKAPYLNVTVLPRARGALLRALVVAGVPALEVVAGAGARARHGQALQMQRLSGGGLVLYAVTILFMSVDWVMSLDPHWFSTILRDPVHGRPGPVGAGVHDRGGGAAVAHRADVARDRARRTCTTSAS